MTEEEGYSSLPCPCPSKSYCSYSTFSQSDFWSLRGVWEGLYWYNCTCREGFYGKDGWRCEPIDECLIVENWPCAPIEQGGYCVDTHPDNDNSPKYECGCRKGFKADENYPIDPAHGILHCIKEEVEENVNLEDDTIINNNIVSPSLSLRCLNDENLFPSVTSLNVTGDPNSIVNDIK